MEAKTSSQTLVCPFRAVVMALPAQRCSPPGHNQPQRRKDGCKSTAGLSKFNTAFGGTVKGSLGEGEAGIT